AMHKLQMRDLTKSRSKWPIVMPKNLGLVESRRKMEKQIIIFLKNGETLLFQDVSNVDVTDEYVAFDYFGKSTNQEKSGAFYFDNIAGWSVSADLLD
ncbi:TPA: hypothetical protein ACHWCH_001128, partial [Streptococcus suis]